MKILAVTRTVTGMTIGTGIAGANHHATETDMIETGMIGMGTEIEIALKGETAMRTGIETTKTDRISETETTGAVIASRTGAH